MPLSRHLIAPALLVTVVTALSLADAAVAGPLPVKANPSAAVLQCGGYLDRLSYDKEGEEQDRYRILARRFVMAGNALGDFAGIPAAEQRRRFELGRVVYNSEVKDDFARKCPVFEPLVNRTIKTIAEQQAKSDNDDTL